MPFALTCTLNPPKGWSAEDVIAALEDAGLDPDRVRLTPQGAAVSTGTLPANSKRGKRGTVRPISQTEGWEPDLDAMVRGLQVQIDARGRF